MSVPSQDIVTYLTDNTSLVFNQDLFIGVEPDEPNPCVTLYDTGGDPLHDLCKDSVYNNYIQVRTRAVDYVESYTLQETIRDVLDKVTNETINGLFYISILNENGPTYLMRDAQNRKVFISNYLIKRRI